jgi:hypothetical protein
MLLRGIKKPRRTPIRRSKTTMKKLYSLPSCPSNSDTEFNPLVSFYSNAYENLPTEIAVAKFIADIKNGAYASLIKQIRQRFQKAIARGVPYADAKKAVDSLKKKLGAVTLAGIQAMRANKFAPQFTGLIQADFDLLGDKLGYVRELLASDPHVFCFFLSATGEGLKAFYRIPICKNADEYKTAFDTLARHVFAFTGCKIDELKEVARLCYASHDKDCYHNPQAAPLPVDFSQRAEIIKPPTPPKPPATAAVESRVAIAERILGAIERTATGDFCKCPGEHLHTNGEAAKDCRVHLDGAPNIFCVHKSCESVVAEINRQLQSEIGKAEKPATPGGDSGETPLATKVQKPKPALQGSAVNLPEVEVWPETVNGADILSQIAETFTRYIALPAGAADALALWVAHAHAFKAFLCSPRLNINSPEKRCGKTTARDVVAVFSPRPLLTENLSVAVLFRLVDAHAPTILADEYDAWIHDNEELRGLLNSGHRRGGQAFRCVGDNNEVRGFQVFAPAVLCGIGALPGTLHDRSIEIRLERAKPGELRKRFDSRRTESEQELCRKLARWCADNLGQLEACDPVLPGNAFNRLADNWRPLFAVAEIAGREWPQRAADAFTKLTGTEDSDAQGMGVMLLADIKRAFAAGGGVKMFSKTIIETLCGMSDRPWSEAHKGKPITETWLARRLRAFGISSRDVRIGEQHFKGYELADFQEAFARYLPNEGAGEA